MQPVARKVNPYSWRSADDSRLFLGSTGC